jgi:hypothetical protein
MDCAFTSSIQKIYFFVQGSGVNDCASPHNPFAMARNSNFWILPVEVFGNS